MRLRVWCDVVELEPQDGTRCYRPDRLHARLESRFGDVWLPVWLARWLGVRGFWP